MVYNYNYRVIVHAWCNIAVINIGLPAHGPPIRQFAIRVLYR